MTDDRLLELIDRVADVKITGDSSKFPANATDEFKAAAIDVLEEMGAIVEDAGWGALELDDLRDMVRGFHAAGDQRRYAACAAIYDWVVFDNERRTELGQRRN